MAESARGRRAAVGDDDAGQGGEFLAGIAAQLGALLIEVVEGLIAIPPAGRGGRARIFATTNGGRC